MQAIRHGRTVIDTERALLPEILPIAGLLRFDPDKTAMQAQLPATQVGGMKYIDVEGVGRVSRIGMGTW